MKCGFPFIDADYDMVSGSRRTSRSSPCKHHHRRRRLIVIVAAWRSPNDHSNIFLFANRALFLFTLLYIPCPLPYKLHCLLFRNDRDNNCSCKPQHDKNDGDGDGDGFNRDTRRAVTMTWTKMAPDEYELEDN